MMKLLTALFLYLKPSEPSAVLSVKSRGLILFSD